MSTATGKDIHVESMDAEVTAAIRKDLSLIHILKDYLKANS